MKNKKFIAFLLAVGMLGSLTAFYACNNTAPPNSTESSESLENLGNSSNTITSDFEEFSSESFSSEESKKPEINSSSNSNTNSSSSNSSNSSSNSSSSGGSSSSNTTPPSNSGSSSTPSTPVSTSAQYIRCTGERVNIRSGAGTEYSVLGSAEEGTMYALIEKKGNWYKTYYRNKVAYIYASYAQVVTLEKSKNTKAENVIEEGYKLIGTPYVYGAVRLHNGEGKLLAGFSVQKFDCSSLMQYIFYHGADKNIGTHTREQVTQGKYVKPADLQRGDCIFFTNEERQYNTGVERVGHVAIYLGNNYILHTASDYARIEKMTASRWNFYIEARRFV